MKPKKTSVVDAVKDLVRRAGLRCTAARLTVMRHLLEAQGPESHAEVSAALAHRGFDRATIYRNLTELTEAKLVSRVELGDHVWRFEVRRESRPGRHGEDHPHFLCTSCGEVSCLDDVEVAITPKPGAAVTPPAAGASKSRARGVGKGGGKDAGKTGGQAAPAAKKVIRSVTEVLLKGQCGNCG